MADVKLHSAFCQCGNEMEMGCTVAKVELDREDDGTYLVIVRDLAGCVACGNAREAAAAERVLLSDVWHLGRLLSKVQGLCAVLSDVSDRADAIATEIKGLRLEANASLKLACGGPIWPLGPDASTGDATEGGGT
jgi:hypothetical protein